MFTGTGGPSTATKKVSFNLSAEHVRKSDAIGLNGSVSEYFVHHDYSVLVDPH